MSGADSVVVNSVFTRGVVGRVFPGLTGEGKREVGVVYPCVDTMQKEKEGEDGTADTWERPLWEGIKVLLSINRFERKKNIALAIEAFHGLGAEGRKGCRLVVAGMNHRTSYSRQYSRC